MLDNAIHWIKLYTVDNAIRFAITHPPDSNLFVQLGPLRLLYSIKVLYFLPNKTPASSQKLL